MNDAMLRPSQVAERTGLSRTTIWRRVRTGNFPPPIVLGPNAIGWPTSVVNEWLDTQPRRTLYQSEWAQGVEKLINETDPTETARLQGRLLGLRRAVELPYTLLESEDDARRERETRRIG